MEDTYDNPADRVLEELLNPRREASFSACETGFENDDKSSYAVLETEDGSTFLVTVVPQ